MKKYTKYKLGADCNNGANKEHTLGPPDIVKTREGKPFEIDRPSFLSDTVVSNIRAQEIGPNFRGGTGNREIERNSFLGVEPVPRQFPELPPKPLLVELSDKSISEIFQTKIPDPGDVLWLAEEARLKAFYARPPYNLSEDQIRERLKIDKPLGREQRKINSTKNINEDFLTLSQKINTLAQNVSEGRLESKQQQANTLGRLAILMRDINTVESLTRDQITKLTQTMTRIGAPTNYKDLGLTSRFVDIDYYNENAGLINLLLFRTVDLEEDEKQYNYERMVKDLALPEKTNGLPAIKITTLVESMGRPGRNRKFLDLQIPARISMKQLINVGKIFGGMAPPVFNINPKYILAL